jgi:diacylglycerol kinase (ATP)
MKLRWSSFQCALAGIVHLIKTQCHARWHLLSTVTVIALGFGLRVSIGEWLALLVAMALVWTAEAFNTAIELLGDAITKENNPLIGRAKDVAAGAVLLAAVFAAIIGGIIFLPKLLP